MVWSWQQALLAAGLRRQLARRDLSPTARGKLLHAERALWMVIEATSRQRASELWSWRARAGAFELVPFGQERGHVDESNAAQLWSTVYLALPPPARP